MNSRSDLVTKQRYSSQPVFVEGAQEHAAGVNHRLPFMHQLLDAVVLAFGKEVRHRVNDLLGHELFSRHPVMDADVLRSVDFAEPVEAVSTESLNDNGHTGMLLPTISLPLDLPYPVHAMASDQLSPRWYYCLDHKRVEPRDGCRAEVRLGPYDTRQEAARALEKVAERNAEWDNDPAWNDEDDA